LADKVFHGSGSYYCIEELPEAMQNLSLQPDGASDAGTAFTRYTVAGAQTITTQSQSSSRTAYVHSVLLPSLALSGRVR